jgi:hypothetical protein
MLRQFAGLVRRFAAESARPYWTLLAISYLLSAAIVLSIRSVLGISE